MSGDNYVYRETINKINAENQSRKVKEAETKGTEETKETKEDFEKTLKEIQTTLQSTLANSLNSINLGSAVNPTGSGISGLSNGQAVAAASQASAAELAKALSEALDKFAALESTGTSKPAEAAKTAATVKSAETPNTANSNEAVKSLAKSNEGIDVNSTKPGYVSIAPEGMREIFEEAAKTYGLDQKLLELIGYHESRFQQDATSRHGAMGIMQLMPGTASDMGVTDAYDIRQNIMGASKLLRQLSDAYNGNLDLILSGYSAGMNAVQKYGGVPPYEETLNYIDWIRERYP